MADHHHELFSAWDAAMTELNDAAEALRDAVEKSAHGKDDPNIEDMVNRLSEKKRTAMNAWVAYTDASGFGRI